MRDVQIIPNGMWMRVMNGSGNVYEVESCCNKHEEGQEVHFVLVQIRDVLRLLEES